jgi:hypothetical protein
MIASPLYHEVRESPQTDGSIVFCFPLVKDRRRLMLSFQSWPFPFAG